MVRVVFTQNLARHADASPCDVAAGVLRDVLQRAFATKPAHFRGYILDDQGGVRKHVVVFINGDPISDRQHLSDDVPDHAEVFIAQALSGG